MTHHSALYGRELPKGTTLKENFGWKNGPMFKYIPTFDDGSIVNILTGRRRRSIEGVEGKAEIKPGDRVPVINKNRQPGDEDDERLMFYLPGSDFQVFPEGAAKRIRASNALMWEVHYSPNGKPTTDRERIGLWLAKSPDQQEVHVIRNGSGQHIIENGEVGSILNLPAIPPHAADSAPIAWARATPSSPMASTEGSAISTNSGAPRKARTQAARASSPGGTDSRPPTGRPGRPKRRARSVAAATAVSSGWSV